MAGRVCHHPGATIVVALLLTALLGWAATGLTFNSNILELLPRNSESLRYQRRVALESDLSPVFNLVVAEDLGELRAMRERADREPSIARFESVLPFLPDDTEATRQTLARWGTRLDEMSLPTVRKPVERRELVDSLTELERALTGAADDAFTAGLGGIAGQLEDARVEAEACIVSARDAPEAAVADWTDGQERIAAWVEETLGLLRRSARAQPPSPDNLPSALHDRFFTGSGKPLGFLYPAGSVFEPEELARYVEASRRVSPDSIGFPTMFHKMSRRITRGFLRAVFVGAVLVGLILLVDFRSLRHAALAALPLAIGLVWTLGAMRLVGMSFNFANLVAVPLIVGVGIDNGVHVIHRVRLEGGRGMGVVLRHTGRAILISSLTTMIGFGCLSLASHRGLESLGLLLLLGVGSCLVASILVLPNLLVVLKQVPDSDEARGVELQ
jgi:hypothetical protein